MRKEADESEHGWGVKGDKRMESGWDMRFLV